MHIDSSWKTMNTLETEISHYFGPTTCNMATYACRVKKQYMRIVFETNKLRQLFNKIFEKFLKAIDHMEFHPTLGKEKKGTSYRIT